MKDAAPDNTLMAMIVRRCNLDATATALLHRIEAAAWDFIAGEPSDELLRHVFAVVGVTTDGEVVTLTPSARRLLVAHGRARRVGVPADVLASFTEDALRLALLLRDAFERGYQLGRSERRAAVARERAPSGSLPH